MWGGDISAALLSLGFQFCRYEAFIPYFSVVYRTNKSVTLCRTLAHTLAKAVLHFRQARCLLHKMVLFVTQGKPEMCICFFKVRGVYSELTQWVFKATLSALIHFPFFLPLWSLMSTAAWASNSREISSLLPLRAAWCNGDSLHTQTGHVWEKI